MRRDQLQNHAKGPVRERSRSARRNRNCGRLKQPAPRKIMSGCFRRECPLMWRRVLGVIKSIGHYDHQNCHYSAEWIRSARHVCRRPVYGLAAAIGLRCVRGACRQTGRGTRGSHLANHDGRPIAGDSLLRNQMAAQRSAGDTVGSGNSGTRNRSGSGPCFSASLVSAGRVSWGGRTPAVAARKRRTRTHVLVAARTGAGPRTYGCQTAASCVPSYTAIRQLELGAGITK
jgi:hypothetical protein